MGQCGQAGSYALVACSEVVSIWSDKVVVATCAGREEMGCGLVAIRAYVPGRIVFPSKGKELVEKHKIRRGPVELGSLCALIDIAHYL